MPPLVSVVIPCRNAGRMLALAVQSMLTQTYPNLELIFVDNGSTDGSAETAQALAAGSGRGFKLVRCPEPGANHARNAGYDHVRGAYVQWLDADDALGREKIALQVEALERNDTADIAYCDWLSSVHLPDGRREDRVVALASCADQIQRTLSGVWYPPHSYLLRRQAADRLQAERAWLGATKVGTDVEYSALAAMLGMGFRHVPGGRIQYNAWSPTQISGAGTSYAARVAALQTVYSRLREFALRPDIAPRITARHRILLEQDWNVWAMPPGSVEIRTRAMRRVELRHVASGRKIAVRPREAAVASAMQAIAAARAFAHHALLIAERVPALAGDHPFIVATLDRFRHEGLLTPVRLAQAA